MVNVSTKLRRMDGVHGPSGYGGRPVFTRECAKRMQLTPHLQPAINLPHQARWDFVRLATD